MPVSKIELPPQLEALYNEVPKVTCQKCGCCCGPVQLGLAPIEKVVIKAFCKRNNIALGDFFDGEKAMLNLACGYWQCPMFKDSKCLIYEVRPLICRLQGTVEKLPCPHDINRIYPFTDTKARELLQKSLRLSCEGVWF